MDLEERELHLIIGVIGEILRQDADDDDFIIEELLQPFRGERMLGRNRVRNGEREFSGIENYIERTVTGYTDPYFKKHFRMSRRSFQVLTVQIGAYENEVGAFNYSRVPIYVKLLMTLWTLGNKESFRGIGDRFGMHQGNVHFIFLKMVHLFRRKSKEFIKWPRRDMFREIAATFTFPDTIGALDTTFVKIPTPRRFSRAYTNRKKFCAVSLQAICLPNREFIDCSTGYPSSMHDATVFAHSRIGRNLNVLLANTQYHLLGDGAYPLTMRLMKPFPDRGNLEEDEKHYNRLLSANRSVIERAFTLLKGKWRRLKCLDMLLLEKIPDVIIAACCLHNSIIQQGDVDEEIESDDDESDSEDDDEEARNNATLAAAERKRNRIKNLLFEYRKRLKDENFLKE